VDFEIELTREAALAALELPRSIAAGKSAMPALTCVLLTQDGPNRLKLQASDLLRTATVVTDASFKGSGSLLLSGKALSDAIAALPPGIFTLKSNSKTLACTLQSGRRKFSVSGLPAEDFPTLAMPDGEPKTFKARLLLKAIDTVAPAASDDDTRPHLAAIKLEHVEGKFYAIATDGHRLHAHETELEGGGLDVLIPQSIVPQLRSMLVSADKDAEVTFLATQTEVVFRIGSTTVSGRKVEAKFPTWREVIPKHLDRKAHVNRSSLLAELRSLAKATSGSKGVSLTVSPGKIALSCSDAETGATSETELDADTSVSLKIGFNVTYLAEAAHACDGDTLVLRFDGELDPLLVECQGTRVVLMPMRI